MKRGMYFLIVMTMVCVVMVSGCTQEPSAETVKDTLVWGVNAEAASLDPAKSSDTVTHMMMFQIYDTLVKEKPEDYKTLVPGLAERWEFNSDNTEITFYLREGVKFHNGDTMTADDVYFSLQRSLDSPYSSGISEPIDHFEKVDDMAVKCVLKHPYAPILNVMTNMTYSIVSKRAVEEAESQGIDFGRNPCGTGAYKFVEWKSGDVLRLQRFDDYYEGPAQIENLVYKLVPDASAGAIALEDGTLDSYYLVSAADEEHLKSLNHIAYVTCPGIGFHHITFNVTDGIFTDVRLRQAIAYALDRQEIVDVAFDGKANVVNCPAPPAAFGYIEDFQWYEHDVEKAKQLMAEAGYPSGFDVVLSVQSSDVYLRPAQVIQEQLRKVGINVTLNKMDRAAYLQDVADKRNFVFSSRMTTAAILEAEQVLSVRFHSSKIGGGKNYSGYANPQVDSLLDQARKTSDDAKRLELYRQIYEILKEDVPLIPTFSGDQAVFYNAKIKNFYPNPGFKFPVHLMYFEQ